MRTLALLTLVVAAGPSCARDQAAPSAADAPGRPDVVLIVIDDLGWGDLALGVPGIAERSDVATPALARLAAESVAFTRCYAAAPNCAPSRASLQTGRLTPRHGVFTVGNPARGEARHRALVPAQNRTALEDSEVTLGEVLSARGYRAAHIGKWHLGDDPRTQGYAVNVGGTRRGHPKSYFAPYSNPALPDGPDGESLTTRLTDEALALLADEGGAPLFLHLAYYTVHTPLQARPDAVQAKRETGSPNPTYAAMLEAMDAEVDRLLAALDGRQRDAIVLFTSDNGGYGPATNQEPLRGYKGTLDEGGLRVPLLVRARGAAPRVSGAPVHHVDLLPTIAALTGAAPPEVDLDGVDLTAHLLEASPLAPRSLPFHFPAYLEGASDRFPHFRTEPGGALVEGRWKLVEFFQPTGPPRRELYDLDVDPREATNLADSNGERTSAMAGRLTAWRERTGAPLPTPKASGGD